LSAVAFNLRVGIDHRLLRYLQSGTYHPENGVTVRQEIVFVLCLALALFAWTWTSCFVLAALSRRALWLTGLIFYIVVLNSFLARLVVSGAISTKYPIIGDRAYALPVVFLAFLLPLSPSKLLFLLGAVWGARSGVRGGALGLWQATIWALSVMVVTALIMWTGGWYEESHSLILPWVGTTPESWRGGVWHAGPWPTHLLPLLLVSWPAVYMLAASWQRRNEVSYWSRGLRK
jgi:hypothetical protein